MQWELPGHLALLVGGGVTAWLLADFGFSLFAESGAFGVWLNVGWMVASLLLAGATWARPAASEPKDAGAGAAADGATHSGIAIALVPLLVPGAIAVVRDLRDDPASPVLLYGATVLLVALAFARGARILQAEADARATVRSTGRSNPSTPSCSWPSSSPSP